jgi:hypothetical protein
MGSQLVWAARVPRMVLPCADRWEHVDTSTTVAAAAGTMGDSPTFAVEDDVAVLPVVYRPDGTSGEDLQHYLKTVLTWPSSSFSPPRLSRHRRHPLGQ